MLNKVMIIGRLTSDPELRYIPSGEAVCKIGVACNEQWKDKTGNKQSSVEYFTVILWRKLGEIAGQYLKKGKLVYIEGKMKSREFEGQDKIKRKIWEIIASEMKMLSEAQPQSTPTQNTPNPANEFSDVPF